MTRILRPASDQDWRHAAGLVAELRAWDLDESRALGLDPDEVAAFFHAGSIDDKRRSAAPPAGCFLLALESDEAAGCAGFRSLEPGVCEVHDVWVRPTSRGRGIGAGLMRRLAEEACASGYRAMRLETATFMRDAQRLYGAHGYRARGPYHDIPARFLPFTIPMERRLGAVA